MSSSQASEVRQDGQNVSEVGSDAAMEHDKDAQGNPIEPATDFVTTSYVLDSLNTALNSLNPPTTAATAAVDDAGDQGEGESSVSVPPGEENKRTFFELQKRLPDGSTRKATDEEMSSADMKNKLEQAAKFTENMSHDEKIEWAQKQRQHGNQLYKEGKYKEAIDIYLTCLVVRDTAQQEVDQLVLILPVMNNLAQCTLQLGWYQKTEHFCTIAMESLDDSTSEGPLVSKVYFKRAKARRLRGMYKEAKLDLEIASLKLGMGDNSDGKTNEEEEKTPEQKAIEREFQLLAKATKEGKKNKQRAQKAMQKVLGESGRSDEKKSEENATHTSSSDTLSTASALTDEHQQSSESKGENSTKSKGKSCERNETGNLNTADDDDAPLYHEKHVRTHSAIRKRPEGPPPYERTSLPVDLSYWQIYRLIAGRVAQRILDIIGEDEGPGFGGTDNAQEDRLKED